MIDAKSILRMYDLNWEKPIRNVGGSTRKKYSQRFKRSVVKASYSGNHTKLEMTKMFNISINTVYRFLSADKVGKLNDE